MSNALAIASVSAVLTDLLRNGIIDKDVPGAVGDVTVSALPPDRVAPTNGSDTTRLNLFMYHVTPNAAWRNIGLPALNSRGERVGDPPLALDLHYLLTAYGAQDYYAEILLGYAMQLLHESPVLARDDVRTALTSSLVSGGTGLPPNLANLSTSGLADQVELIKLTPESLSTEEISRLWAAFQTNYRATAAYCASVVLIESGRTTTAPLPVRGYTVGAHPLRRPVIESIAPQTGAGEPINADSTIVISGRNLAGDDTLVRVGGELVTPAAGVTPTAITVALPAGLAAGVQTLQVVQPEDMGIPPEPHRGLESNVAPFLLQPKLTAKPTATMSVETGSSLRAGTITVDLAPAVRAGQRVALLLNQLLPTPVSDGVVARSYRFAADPIAAPMSSLDIAATDVEPGTYLVRVQVDGAENALDVDTTGRFSGPTVVIP